MGFLGLFIGPVLMALIVAIWREWLREIDVMDQAEAVPVTLEEPFAPAVAPQAEIPPGRAQAG